MQIKADLKCYYCGYVTGHLEGDTSRPLQVAAFIPAPGSTPVKRGEQIRCARCYGPVYMDDIETIRPRRPRPRQFEEAEVEAPKTTSAK
jgi:hypothetical protein